MNSVNLTGRLVANPELKTTDSGIEVTNFRIAVNKDYAKKGEERKADFFEIVAWRQTAVFVCRYFHKGDGIGVVGKLQTRTYQAKDGTNRYVVEVVADNVEFPLSNSKTDGQAISQNQDYSVPSVPAQTTTPADISNLTLDDDLPF
jgi:single-strand DNA-binding protein